MKILAIETSCDETGISIIDATGSVENSDVKFTVLADELASQAELHSEYGGVYPTLAKREHIKALPIILEQALRNAGKAIGQRGSLTISKIDAIAVTHGPGLEPALWTGINFAQEITKEAHLPLMPINHMEGHIYSTLLESNDAKNYRLKTINYPAVALLISGGHTEMVLIKKPFDYEYLGGTVDDAVGEAFDKVARMLGLGYPGGPLISKLAQQARNQAKTAKPGFAVGIDKKFPRPMMHSGDLNFSFSGLKTAVLYHIKKNYEDGHIFTTNEQQIIAREFEDACADVLTKKVVDAVRDTGARTLLIGGGVAANTFINNNIKDVLAKEFDDVQVHTPSKGLTGDNALMISIVGYLRNLRGESLTDLTELKAHGTLKL